MADTVNTAYAYLQAWVNTFEQHYRPGVGDFLRRFGKTTRLLPQKNIRMMGSSLEYEVKAYHNRSTTVTNDLMKAMPDPAPGRYIRFTVTMDHTDPSNNDFAAFEIGFRTTIWDIWKRSDRTWKDAPDFIRKDVQEGLDDVKETFAKYLHLPVDGQLAQIQDQRVDDSDTWGSCTNPYVAGADSCALLLDPTAIARIGDGQRVEFRSTAGALIVDNVLVTYVHPGDEMIFVQVTGDSVDAAGSPVTNCDLLVDNIEVFLNDSYNVAPQGTLARLFDVTQTYYGRDRTADAFKMLMPLRYDAAGGGAAVPLTPDAFRRVGEMIGWQAGGFDEVASRAMIMSRYEFREISRFVKDAGITLLPALESEVGRKLVEQFGLQGFVLHDPNLGSVMIVVDDFAEPGQIDFLNTSQWEIVNPIDGGFRMFPGTIAGIWNRNSETDGSGRPSKVYSANGIQVAAFVCRWPKGQVRLSGLVTTQ